MPEFHHVGVVTDKSQPGEVYVEDTKVWVTDPENHPLRFEYLRFEPDSPTTGPVREQNHVAYKVDNLDEWIEGEEVILGPFDPLEGLTVVFILKDGLVIEFMKFQDKS